MDNNRGSGRSWDMAVPTGVGPVTGGTPVVLANGAVLMPMSDGEDGDFITWILAPELVELPAASGAGTGFTTGAPLYWEGGEVVAAPSTAPAVFIGRAIGDKVDDAALAIVQLPGILGSYVNLLNAEASDPGDGEEAPLAFGGHTPLTSGAGAETRDVPAPLVPGIKASIAMDVDGGGDITVTFAVPINQTGNNTAVFADAGQALVLESIQQAGTLRWLVTHNEGTVVLSTV